MMSLFERFCLEISVVKRGMSVMEWWKKSIYVVHGVELKGNECSRDRIRLNAQLSVVFWIRVSTARKNIDPR